MDETMDMQINNLTKLYTDLDDLETALCLVIDFNDTINEVQVDASLLSFVSKIGFNEILKEEMADCHRENFSDASVANLKLGSVGKIGEIIDRVWKFIENLIERIKELWGKLTDRNGTVLKEVRDINDRITLIYKKIQDMDKKLPSSDEVNNELSFVKKGVYDQLTLRANINYLMEGLTTANYLNALDVKDAPNEVVEPFKTMRGVLDHLGMNIGKDLIVKILTTNSKSKGDLKTKGFTIEKVLRILEEGPKLNTVCNNGKDAIKEIKGILKKEEQTAKKNPALSKNRTENAKQWVSAYVKYFSLLGKECSICVDMMLDIAKGAETALKQATAKKEKERAHEKGRK